MTDQPVPDRSTSPTPPPNLDGGDAEFATGAAEAATSDSEPDGQTERSGDAPKPSPDI
jgi:hypothetical protein